GGWRGGRRGAAGGRGGRGGGEGEGPGLPGRAGGGGGWRRPPPPPPPPRHFQPAGPGLRQEVRRRRGAAQGSHDPHRLEEPPQRRAEPEGAVPEGSAEGDDRLLAAGGGWGRGLRLLRRQGRVGGGPQRPYRRCASLHQETAL